MKPLHLRLMAWAKRMADEGDDDCAWWVQKMVAQEQKAGRKPRGESKVKVRLAKTGQEAFVPRRMIDGKDE